MSSLAVCVAPLVVIAGLSCPGSAPIATTSVPPPPAVCGALVAVAGDTASDGITAGAQAPTAVETRTAKTNDRVRTPPSIEDAMAHISEVQRMRGSAEPLSAGPI